MITVAVHLSNHFLVSADPGCPVAAAGQGCCSNQHYSLTGRLTEFRCEKWCGIFSKNV